jgi:hypothetical protein
MCGSEAGTVAVREAGIAADRRKKRRGRERMQHDR